MCSWVALTTGSGPACQRIAQGLAKLNPANMQWKHDLSLSYGQIGNVLVARGDGAGALKAYQESQRIAEGLAKRGLANTDWQVILSRGYVEIGDVLVSQGDGAGALAAFQECLRIAEGLVNRDPENTQRQLCIAACCASLGELDSTLLMRQRRDYLSRGLTLLNSLKQEGRLDDDLDFTDWFVNALNSLE